MKFKKTIAAVAAVGAIAGAAFIANTSAQAAPAGNPGLCERTVHKVDDSGSPLAGAEFTYRHGTGSLADSFKISAYASIAEARESLTTNTAAAQAYLEWKAITLPGAAKDAAWYKYKPLAQPELEDGHVFVTDTSGNFTFVQHCELYGGDKLRVGNLDASMGTFPSLEETKAPVGKALAGGVINQRLTLENPNVTFVAGEYTAATDANPLPVVFGSATSTIIVVDHDAVEPTVVPVTPTEHQVAVVKVTGVAK